MRFLFVLCTVAALAPLFSCAASGEGNVRQAAIPALLLTTDIPDGTRVTVNGYLSTAAGELRVYVSKEDSIMRMAEWSLWVVVPPLQIDSVSPCLQSFVRITAVFTRSGIGIPRLRAVEEIMRHGMTGRSDDDEVCWEPVDRN